MIRRLIYLSTVAGIAGLVVLHSEAFGTILGSATSTFRKAVQLV